MSKGTTLADNDDAILRQEQRGIVTKIAITITDSYNLRVGA